MISSSVNPKTTITPDSWAVTLICDKKNFHARLIFEGMTTNDSNSYFFQVAELLGNKGLNSCGWGSWNALNPSNSGNVEISARKPRNKFKIKYRKKSETWVRSRDKVEEVLRGITSEKTGGVPFHICGNKSIFSKSAEIYEIYCSHLNVKKLKIS